ncbi:MAG: NAD-dependent deacylase [Gemmatimonadetes bacterium]|nr:NAD-dependent deacylase [Gemmatimonadota bacterium]
MDRVRRSLAEAERVVVLTGAGVSVESGVPTFRGEEGLWRSHRPEQLATPAAFARDPRLVWEWYAWRRERVGGCRPNAAHRALARWALSRPGVLIVTQNVDGLHGDAAIEAAGDRAPETAAWPIELHGSLFRVRCTGCGERRPHVAPIDTGSRASLPRCPDCGALLRPDVVWFGEPLEDRTIGRALAAARGCDACLVVGTSAIVHPAASVAVEAAHGGAVLVEVNPDPTPLSPLAGVSLRATAATAVPRLLGGPNEAGPA